MSVSLDLLIFGGAFDPPHLGHVAITRRLLAEEIAKEVIVVPVGQHPFDKALSTAEHRLAMTKLAFSQLVKQKRVHVSEYELQKQGAAYSYQTLLHFQKINPDKKIGWLIGSDNVVTFTKWQQYQELLDRFTVLVYPRAGYQLSEQQILPGMKYLDSFPEEQCASRNIRQQIINQNYDHRSQACLSDQVWQYIDTHKLYIT